MNIDNLLYTMQSSLQQEIKKNDEYVGYLSDKVNTINVVSDEFYYNMLLRSSLEVRIFHIQNMDEYKKLRYNNGWNGVDIARTCSSTTEYRYFSIETIDGSTIEFTSESKMDYWMKFGYNFYAKT